jgi:type 1 glutamine amidotransferase
MVTRTHGYRHTAAIDAATALFQEPENTADFRVEFSESVSDFTPEKLADFDVLLLANSTLRSDITSEDPRAGGWRGSEPDDPVEAAHIYAMVDFVRQGGGLVAAHSALDALYAADGYRKLVGGGLFVSHPWTQTVTIVNEAPDHPAMAHFGATFSLKDEIYVLDANPRPNVTVLASLDMTSVDAGALEGRTALGDEARRDFPISWTRPEGAGRVFVTKLGHFSEVWTNPGFVEHVLNGIRFAASAKQNRMGSE